MADVRNVYLVGVMGSGKSSVGRELARLLAQKFVDLDRLISKRVGKSIAAIFKTDGEAYFRKVEAELLKSVTKEKGQTVATGGGAVLDPSNCEAMKTTGTIIFLEASLDELWSRVSRNKRRPLLLTANPKQTLEDIAKKREPIYRDIANTTFNTNQKSPQALALEIFQTCFEAK